MSLRSPEISSTRPDGRQARYVSRRELDEKLTISSPVVVLGGGIRKLSWTAGSCSAAHGLSIGRVFSLESTLLVAVGFAAVEGCTLDCTYRGTPVARCKLPAILGEADIDLHAGGGLEAALQFVHRAQLPQASSQTDDFDRLHGFPLLWNPGGSAQADTEALARPHTGLQDSPFSVPQEC
jgi:hypothetical protein